MNITIKQDDIIAARALLAMEDRPARCYICPVAHAIDRCLGFPPGKVVSVSAGDASVTDKNNNNDTVFYVLPDKAYKWILKFDAGIEGGKEVKPISFRITKRKY